MQTWIEAETKGADFGDKRLDQRYQMLLEQLSGKPSLSIPGACHDLSGSTAAYRFCDNDKTSAAKVFEPHRVATLDRIRAHPVVIVAQDTTEIELTRRQERVGGPLNDESRWGLYAHPLLALTPERVPLGVVSAKIWSRDPVEFAKSQKEKRKKRKASAIEDKESYRWLAGYHDACAVADAVPETTVVMVSDSEGDIYECLQAGMERSADFIVRACQDRAVLDEDFPHLMQTLMCRVKLGTITVDVSKRDASTGNDRKRQQARKARKAKLTIRSARVLLRGPNRPGGKLANVEINVVWAKEERPPAGEEPIEWVLLTNLPVESFVKAKTVLDYYCCRWEIEVYFRVLKSGCRIEDLQFERQDRYEVCLALYMIVAWRVLHLLMLGRTDPTLSCAAALTEAEWKSVYVIRKCEEPPAKPPSLAVLIPLIAELGGYLNRKGDGPPGPKTMWIGLQRMRDYATAWTAFRPPGKRIRCVER